jgi:hypothetical protein
MTLPSHRDVWTRELTCYLDAGRARKVAPAIWRVNDFNFARLGALHLKRSVSFAAGNLFRRWLFCAGLIRVRWVAMS